MEVLIKAGKGEEYSENDRIFLVFGTIIPLLGARRYIKFYYTFSIKGGVRSL